MTADVLKLERAGSANRAALAELRSRLAALRGCAADRIIILPTPEAAGAFELPTAECETFGPDDAPLTAVYAEAPVDPTRFETLLGDQAIAAGLAALRPAARTQSRLQKIEKEKIFIEISRILETWDEVGSARVLDGGLRVEAAQADRFSARLRTAGVAADLDGTTWSLTRLPLKDARALAERLDAGRGRRAEIRRTTKETDIFVALTLEEGGPVRIATGIEYFDHMLEQIARHGGLSLEIACEGDTGVDAHHTIEDVCLALGDALAQALGDRRGIGRFGFELPMDETRAGVWIDLSGRPFCRFDGDIPGERVGEFPVEMTPHAFRSIADSLKAAIHVEVSGENAHHMIEACFKAFGRALRQAIRIDGDAIPSTKGVL